MRYLGAGAAVGAAALLLGVAGADAASSPAATVPDGPELVARAAIGVADLRPAAPSDAAAPAPRHVPIPPRPEAVQVAPGPLGIPGAAYAAYRAAADRMALEAPGCGIEWNLVAAIGRIESGHADGGNVDATGLTLTPIQGPLLDGTLAGNAVIHDGAGFARALGPMQFLTTTWALFGGDNSGEGKADINNLRDAAYGAARYLCSSASGLASEAGQRVAVFAYNNSAAYVDNVVAWSKAYRDRAIPVGGIPDMTAPVAPPKELPKPLPPGQVVIVACGTADGASPRPSAAGKPGATPSPAASAAAPGVPAPGVPAPGAAVPVPTTAAAKPPTSGAPGASAKPGAPAGPVVECAPDPSSSAAPSKPGAPSASASASASRPSPARPSAAPSKSVVPRPSAPSTTGTAAPAQPGPGAASTVAPTVTAAPR